MKRRKFVTAGALLAVLVAAALAAASIGSAATAKSSKTQAGTGKSVSLGSWATKHLSGGNKQGANGRIKQGVPFAPVGASKIAPLPTDKAQLKALLQAGGRAATATNRALPGRRYAGIKTIKGTSVGSSTSFVPHVHSVPIISKSYVAQKPGLNEYWQEATHGGVSLFDGLTPPDQALAEGNGKVLEVVNNVFMVMDTNFHHPLAAEPTEALFAPALLTTGYCALSDPKALYDNATNRWFITEVAYGLPCNGLPGSAVFIAVSNTADPQGTYNIYVLDTSFDGTTCTADGCLADQPLLGADRYGLYISTNSFDWDTPTFNGAQMYVIDKTALAFGSLFPNLAYLDLGATFLTFDGLDFCGGLTPVIALGECWGSVQPATSPNQAFISERGGTELGMSSADYFGSTDNRIAMWAITNTSSISGAGPIFFSAPVQVNTENYGFPVTEDCQVMPQMSAFGESPTQCGNANQPASGNLPLCDTFLFFGGCEPGQIATNDDRMNDVKSVKTTTAAAVVWGGLNTDALIADPLGVLHRKAAIAWFALSPAAWVGPFLAAGAVAGQGYVGNWQNNVLFPSIAVGTDPNGANAAMVYTVTGNNTFPSVAVSKFSTHGQIGSIPVVLQGQDVLDDYCTDFPLCGLGVPPPNSLNYRPRWGDYSASLADGETAYLATEYIQSPSCADSVFIFDPSCGGTRGAFSNWGTGLVKLNLG